MKKNLSSLLITAFILFNSTGLFCQSFRLSGVSDMVRVFEDGYRLPPVYDKSLPESSRGLFMEQFGLNTGHSKVLVTAEISGRTKTIIRESKIVQK